MKAYDITKRIAELKSDNHTVKKKYITSLLVLVT